MNNSKTKKSLPISQLQTGFQDGCKIDSSSLNSCEAVSFEQAEHTNEYVSIAKNDTNKAGIQNAKSIFAIMDGNEAVAYVAYRTNEVCIIYPITPASSMGEFADLWSTQNIPNVWNTVPHVVEMQSEGGAAGAIHGAIQTGTLATTFTSSQGLLLMIPNMYRIAGELTPTVFHVATRLLAYQGMSIYCDHSDVFATRSTGFAMLCSNNVQEAHDFALISQAASLRSRIPFLHFFDGFRTSHEVSKIHLLSNDEMRAMLDEDLIMAHRYRKLSPNAPVVRDAIQNCDTAFQTRESANLFYAALGGILDEYLRRFEKITGRSYHLLDYIGAPDAERIIIIMGSGAETVQETVDYLNARNEKVAVIKAHLFRPFPQKEFLKLIPQNCRAIAVLDRTKESGASGEPLYMEVATTLQEAALQLKLIAGRFGIGSKEFTPAMVKAIFTELTKENPKNHFTIGIVDDVTNTSLSYDPAFDIESPHVIRAIVYGLGADGTVGASKNTIKIIGEETENFVQGYFVYDAKKSGGKTISHLRLSPEPIHSTYLINAADFIACNQYTFIKRFNVLERAAKGAKFLLNSIYPAKEIWQHLPRIIQETIVDKQIEFYVIDAYKVAAEVGMGGRINTIMQTCFFALSKIFPKEVAVEKIKAIIKKTYAHKGEQIIQKNFAAIDQTLSHLVRVDVPKMATSKLEFIPPVRSDAPEYVRTHIAKMLNDHGDELPVSAIPVDGSYPVNTTRWEKNNISFQAASWEPDLCLQCGQCSMVCPHAVIRSKYYPDGYLKNAPRGFKSAKLRDKKFPDHSYTLQSYLENCTGCGLCVEACPARSLDGQKKAINLQAKPLSLLDEQNNIAFFESLPNPSRENLNATSIRDAQYLPPYFEFCGACAGCGEAPYVRLLSQLYGDRLLIADACGCSLVYGCNLPTMPWTKDKEGRGPAYSGSLFEDNAEFGFGFALSADKHKEAALELLTQIKNLDASLVEKLKNLAGNTSAEIKIQREHILQLKTLLGESHDPKAKQLLSLADYLLRPSIWAIGGDGWAYDIGFGGLDHVIASNRKINILVLDTEVYSNTGGQASKATPRGSVAKFAAQGKGMAKKDLGLIAMTYENAYVASIALGANPSHALQVLQEAENFPGPALVIAYCPCIAHDIDMRSGLKQQKLAVKSGYWLLYRYNPLRIQEGLNPLQLDSDAPSIPLRDYMYNEGRFKILLQQNPERAKEMLRLAEKDVERRWQKYKTLAENKCG